MSAGSEPEEGRTQRVGEIRSRRVGVLDTRSYNESPSDDHSASYVDLDGRRFRYEGPLSTAEPGPVAQKWSDFTLDSFRALIALGQERGYRFSGFKEPGASPHILWRHDADHSIHTALKTAEIESEMGVSATYFFSLRLPYYNLLDTNTADIVRRISSLGHTVGLHFVTANPELADYPRDLLEDELRADRILFENLTKVACPVVSFHDPGAQNLLRYRDHVLGGMINAYSDDFADAGGYVYASDSNGYWRHKSIRDTIVEGAEKLHLLTHPEWWLPEALPPRQRIERALLTEARRLMRHYDDHLRRSGRLNVE